MDKTDFDALPFEERIREENFEEAILYAMSVWGRSPVDEMTKAYIRTVTMRYHELSAGHGFHWMRRLWAWLKSNIPTGTSGR